VRDALPSCATPRDHAGSQALSGQSGDVSRGMSHNHTRLILQSQFEVRASRLARCDSTTFPPVRDALPSCSTPRDHAGDKALSGQSGDVSRGMSHNHTRLILQSQFEVVRLVSLDVIARPSRRAGRATGLRHTPRSYGQSSPVGTEWEYKPTDEPQPYPPDTSIAIRSPCVSSRSM